jgi:hypothetical protein
MLRQLADKLRSYLPEPVKRRLRFLLARARQREALRAVSVRPAAARRRYSAGHKQVVFVSEVPRGREAKFAYALRNSGWSVVLLHRSDPNYEIARYFDTAIRFSDPEDAVRQALAFSPVAYHVFSPSGDLPSTHVVNALPGPVVFDTTDLLEVAYLGNEEKLELARHAIDLQRHAMRYADGCCWRDLQVRFAQRRLAYAPGSRILFFPEYCWGSAAERADYAHARPDAPMRCVQAGNFGIEKRGEADWGYLHISEAFVDAGMAFDLFPNWTHYGRGEREFRQIFSDYFSLAERNRLFTLHRPVSADGLIDTLSRYHFGVSLMWAELNGEPTKSVNPDQMGYAISARIFDYLDAGLPVVISKGYRLIRSILRRYGAEIPADKAFMQDIRGRLEPLATLDMHRKAVTASRALAVRRHVHRLENFYRRVASDVGISAG